MSPDDLHVYLDFAATTPLDPAVAESMLPYLTSGSCFGNPSSVHQFGREARAAVDAARDTVAELIGADYGDLYFTSSATEANNLAITGVMRAASPRRNHLVTVATEHHSVLHTARVLRESGLRVTVVPVLSDGRVDCGAVEEAITPDTALVSVMHANNETGVLQPVSEIACLAHSAGALFHTDAVQATPWEPTDVKVLDCDLLSLSAHKLYGPKGAGALYVRSGIKVTPIVYGGSQEREKRAGTENVMAIVGFGAAARLARERRADDAARVRELRDRFVKALQGSINGLRLNGSAMNRLPSIANVSVDGVEGPNLLMAMDRAGVAVSSGSACSSGSIEPSHVLAALGLSPELAASGIRFSLGRTTTWEQLEYAAAVFSRVVERQANRTA